VHSPAAYAQFGTHAIEMPNADQDAEPFLQGCLYHATRCLGSIAASGFQPVEYWLAQLRWMPMSSILQGRFPSHADCLPQAVGGCPIRLHSCCGSSLPAWE
jgi:hypothetical protein